MAHAEGLPVRFQGDWRKQGGLALAGQISAAGAMDLQEVTTVIFCKKPFATAWAAVLPGCP
jgi:hypothetical protein